jgi:hypothetical protein
VSIDQLPDDGSLESKLPSHVYDDGKLSGGDTSEDDGGPPEASAVPDLIPEHREIDRIREGFADKRSSSRGSSTSSNTSLNDFNRTQPLLSLTFPTLFPCGEAEFLHPRLRSIRYVDYVRHLIRYEDGRFARHHRFRFVVFNTIMRRSINTHSSFFVRKMHPKDISLEDLRTAFEDDSSEAEAIPSSITRFAGAPRHSTILGGKATAIRRHGPADGISSSTYYSDCRRSLLA